MKTARGPGKRTTNEPGSDCVLPCSSNRSAFRCASLDLSFYADGRRLDEGAGKTACAVSSARVFALLFDRAIEWVVRGEPPSVSGL